MFQNVPLSSVSAQLSALPVSQRSVGGHCLVTGTSCVSSGLLVSAPYAVHRARAPPRRLMR